MLDLHLLARDPQYVVDQLARRGVDAPTQTQLKKLAGERKAAISAADGLRQALNQASAEVQSLAKAGDTAGVQRSREALKETKAAIKVREAEQSAAEQALETLLLGLPNFALAAVPTGLSEADNQVVSTVGTPPTLAFAAKAHWDLVTDLGLVNFTQAAKLSGARFALYRGAGARLERALASFMLDQAQRHGYLEIAPPLLVRPDAMQKAGQYPKFTGEAFETQDGDYVLIPTAEVPLVGMHQDEILEAAQLPLRYCALTPCFRREAGAAGKDTRGLIRNHQFWKVELVALTTPQDSAAEHERLTGIAESILQALELPYRKVLLCTGDMGFAAAQTYDLEVWLPGQNAYREISSCSNCGDFQARRAAIRYRPHSEAGQSKAAKPRLVHTLNGSSLAVGRTFVAVVENYQQADGSIRVPAALRPYFNQDVITQAE
jgi:seryl-tRNA synthetase